MAKILITGVAGFLGSHLADRLLRLNHEVVGIDNLIGGYIDNVPDKVEFHQMDCADTARISKVMQGVDYVFHGACTAYEGLSVFSPSLVCQNTFQITASVLSAAIQNNISRFVHCSSMARYGSQEVVPFREEMLCKPQDPYGIAKYSAELLVENLCKTHGLDYVIAVPHNIIGPRQKYDDPYRNVASIMINLMLQGRQPIIYGDGMQKRCFSYIDDDVDCLVSCIFNENISQHIINIGPDEEFITIMELAERISKLLDFNLNPIMMPGRPMEVKLASCSADKARTLLGYQTKTYLDDGLKQMIDYIRQRGTKRFKYHLEIEINNDLTPRTWKEKIF